MAFIDEKVRLFDQKRTRLFGIAYRMLGTRDDAEDIVQEAYIRWHNADVDSIESPEAWLVTVTTRLSIDRLRKASAERAAYVGPWLPEPFITDPSASPEDQAELASDLSLAFMAMLERLSPTERAVFLLHDVFDCDYTEIASVIGKSEVASRQIASRARSRVRTERVRFDADESEREKLIRKFAAASFAGDQQTLLALFADDVTLTSDGGGVVTAARKVVTGSKRLARLYTIPVVKNRHRIASRLVRINGELGTLQYVDGWPFSANTFTVEDGKITAVFSILNPDKLRTILELDERSPADLSQFIYLPRLS
jgi:RNA polymerase sigma-70 factor (ECF subfamily)